MQTRTLLGEVSSVSFSETAVRWCPRDTEASVLAQLLRLSHLTVLYGEPGAGKTTLLKNSVLPLLRRRVTDRDFTAAPESLKELPFPDRRQICTGAERAPEVAIFFDEWNEAPLAALDAQMRAALPVCLPRTPGPAGSMAMNLGAWNKEFGVRFLIIFDAFDEYLAASDDVPGIAKFGERFVEVLNDYRAPANILLALRDERPLLERFEGRIARLGDASLRLPSWHRFVGSVHENGHSARPPAAAPPNLGDARAPALRPISGFALHTIAAASRLGDGVSPVRNAVLKRDVQTVRATSVVGRSPSPVLEVISDSNSRSVAVASGLVGSAPPGVTAEAESSSRTVPGVSEVAGSRSPVRLIPTPDSSAPHVFSAQHWRADNVLSKWRVKPAWVALPLIGISLLLIVLTSAKPPSDVTLDLTQSKSPSDVTIAVTSPKPSSDAPAVLTDPKQPSEVPAALTDPKPPSDVTRAPAASESSSTAQPVGSVAEIARLMARADELLAQRDIASARIVLERAVDLGSARATFELAQTYDPIVLDTWQTFGTLGDAARARQLYAKAQAGGVQEARDRLNALRE